METQKMLYRSKRNRLLGGVCGGLAEYFRVDPVLVRMIAIVIGLLTGPVALVAYIVAWIVVPESRGGGSPDKGGRGVVDTKYEVESQEADSQGKGKTPQEPGAPPEEQKAKEPSGKPDGSLSSSPAEGEGDHASYDSSGTGESRNLFGYVLVAIGGVMLLERLAPWLGLTWSLSGAVRSYWPLMLVVLGVVLVMSSRRGERS